jgi:hypothetical protein
METQERLVRVYNLITAAHAQLNKGYLMHGIAFIQTARIIASHSDQFLALNKAQVDDDCNEALALIEKERLNSD